jgi:hypothetical protein
MSTMRDGVCPKCNSNEVYYSTTRGAYGTLLVSFWAAIPTKIIHYVCTDCGNVESYIFDKKALAEISANWNRADGSKRKNDEG